MKIAVEKLKRFLDIIGINGDGFELFVSAGNINSNVINDDRNVVLIAEMPISDGSEMKLRMQKEIALKYLRNIDDKIVDITANDSFITASGKDVTIYFPQLVPFITDKTKKSLPDVSKWKHESMMVITSEMIGKIIGVAENVGELIVTFTSTEGKVSAKAKKAAVIKNVCTLKDPKNFEVSFHVSALKNAFAGIRNNNLIIVIYEETSQGRPPASFSYTVDDILVSGLMMDWKEKEK